MPSKVRTEQRREYERQYQRDRRAMRRYQSRLHEQRTAEDDLEHLGDPDYCQRCGIGLKFAASLPTGGLGTPLFCGECYLEVREQQRSLWTAESSPR